MEEIQKLKEQLENGEITEEEYRKQYLKLEKQRMKEVVARKRGNPIPLKVLRKLQKHMKKQRQIKEMRKAFEDEKRRLIRETLVEQETE